MKFERKSAQSAGDLAMACIKMLKAAPALNTRCIFRAWDSESGAAQYTLKRYFKKGVLYITLSSSAARSMLYMQRDILANKINRCLENDSLFSKDCEEVGFVEKIVLK